MDENKMNAKEFRTEVGREIRRVRKLQKEHWINGRHYYLRVLRVTYDMLGIDAEKVKILQSDPKKWEETKTYLKGIVDWSDFLLTIQPRERQRRKKVEANIIHIHEEGEQEE